MAERPILFSAPMVRAILAGQKTQTRRIVKPQPTLVESSMRWTWPIPTSKVRKGCCTSVCTASREWWEYLGAEQLPYALGDRLWVRETWGYHGTGWSSNDPENNTFRVKYWADEVSSEIRLPVEASKDFGPHQNKPDNWADMDHFAQYDWISAWWDRQRKLPSIFMPRWASRITLEITGVRVERLQDISMKDACAEGVPAKLEGSTDEPWGPLALVNFGRLWNQINGKRADWDSNPWVWVVEFARVQP